MFELKYSGNILSTYDTIEEAIDAREFLIKEIFSEGWKKRMRKCFCIEISEIPHNLSEKQLLSVMCELNGLKDNTETN